MPIVQVPLTLGTGVSVTSGSGSPEGIVHASIGSIYLQVDGANGQTLWKKISGIAATGWTLVTGDTSSVQAEIDALEAQVVALEAEMGRWQEWIVVPGYGVSAPDAAWTGLAYARHLTQNPSAAIANVWRSLGSVTGNFRVVDSLQVLDFLPAVAAGGLREVFWYFSPAGAAPYAHDFQQALPPQIAAPVGVNRPQSLEFMFWVRKRNGSDTPGARQFVGFLTQGDANWSGRNARVGLAGDGVGGFRFQSNNCPDAFAGANENTQTSADANSVQPAALVTPGANWFHVRLKMVSAIDGTTGRVYCFLNGALAATFSSTDNLPRASRSSIDVLSAHYWPISAHIALWGNPDGASQDHGLYLRDVRTRLSDSWDAS